MPRTANEMHATATTKPPSGRTYVSLHGQVLIGDPFIYTYDYIYVRLVGRPDALGPPRGELRLVLVLGQRDVLAEIEHHVLDRPIAESLPVSRLRVAGILGR